VIQDLLGHRHIKSTVGYARVASFWDGFGDRLRHGPMRVLSFSSPSGRGIR
jgi:hypothetical protein